MKLLRDFYQYIKYFIPIILVVFGFSYLNDSILQPYVESKYSWADIDKYESNIWFYIGFTFMAIGLISALHTGIKHRSTKDAFGCAGFFLLLFVFFYVMLQGTVQKFDLIVNTWFTSETFEKKYIVSNKNKNDIALLPITKDYMDGYYREKNLENIIKYRKEKQLPALETLQDGDTINIAFAKGYLDSKYLQ
jgi:uncharacterized membrane protein